jgi:hypothetical protein
VARPPIAIKNATAQRTPPRERAGAGATSGEQVPRFSALSQDWPAGQEGSAQQVSLTQLPEMQSPPSTQSPPSGTSVLVGVTLGVRVRVGDGLADGVAVGVAVFVIPGTHSSPHAPFATKTPPVHMSWETEPTQDSPTWQQPSCKQSHVEGLNTHD